MLTSRSDHVIVYATAKLIMDGGLPNYRPTRLNDSGNFFRPLTKNRLFFHIFIFYLNSPNHALHSCILLGVFLVGKSYWISIFKLACYVVNLHRAVVQENRICFAYLDSVQREDNLYPNGSGTKGYSMVL